MYLNGKYIPYPISPVETFLALGWLTTLKFSLSALGVLWKGTRPDLRSYEEYMTGYYGAGLYKRIFEPFAQKVWGIAASDLAAETARVRLRGNNIFHALIDGFLAKQETYISEFLYPENGIGEIPQKFAEEIEHHGGRLFYQTSVEKLIVEEGRIKRVIARNKDKTIEFEGDTVVNTLPLPKLLPMITPALPQQVLSDGASLHFRGLVLLYLLYSRKVDIKDTWLYFPEEQVSFTRISVPGNFNPARKDENRTCLCVEFTCEVGDHTWSADTGYFASRAQKVLLQSGLLDIEYSEAKIIRIEEGYPVYSIGYEDRLSGVLHSLASLNNIITTGRQGLFRHNNIDQSIQMGLLAAEEIRQNPSDFSAWYGNTKQFNNYRIID
jgi:protoporphyrinogen oxidase